MLAVMYRNAKRDEDAFRIYQRIKEIEAEKTTVRRTNFLSYTKEEDAPFKRKKNLLK